MFVHLDEECLELAASGVDVKCVSRRHECRDVGQHVAEGGVKDHPVDGALPEALRQGEGDQDEDTSQQGEGRASPLDADDGLGVFC